MSLKNDFTLEVFNYGKKEFSMRIRSVNGQPIFSGEGYRSRVYAQKYGEKIAKRFNVQFKDLTTR